MLLNQEYRFQPQPSDLISISKHDNGTVWFSCIDYGNRLDGSRVNGSAFCIVLEPRHLPELRELVTALEAMGWKTAAPSFQDCEVKA